MTLTPLGAFTLISMVSVLSFGLGFFWGYIKGGMDEAALQEEEEDQE